MPSPLPEWSWGLLGAGQCWVNTSHSSRGLAKGVSRNAKCASLICPHFFWKIRTNRGIPETKKRKLEQIGRDRGNLGSRNKSGWTPSGEVGRLAALGSFFFRPASHCLPVLSSEVHYWPLRKKEKRAHSAIASHYSSGNACLAKRHFSGEWGWYILRPHAAGILYAPHPLQGLFKFSSYKNGGFYEFLFFGGGPYLF